MARMKIWNSEKENSELIWTCISIFAVRCAASSCLLHQTIFYFHTCLQQKWKRMVFYQTPSPLPPWLAHFLERQKYRHAFLFVYLSYCCWFLWGVWRFVWRYFQVHLGTSRYLLVLLGTYRYFEVLLGTLRYDKVLWGTCRYFEVSSRYFEALIGTLRYDEVLFGTSIYF